MGKTFWEKIKGNKILLGVLISFSALLLIYVGIAVYFISHFYYGSEVNAISITGKSVEQVKKEMSESLEKYALQLKERDGKSEEIKAADINLKYVSENQIEALKDSQMPFAWIVAVFNRNSNDNKVAIEMTYDKDVLKKQIEKLSCVTGSIEEPKNPTFKYENNSYVIVDEVLGNKINKDVLYEKAAEAISKEETSIDLEALNCYVNPEYNSKSQKVVDAKNLLSKYVASKVTYTIGTNKEVLDGSKINNWLTVDEKYAVALDEGKVKSYVQGLANSYNTAGKTRSFTTTAGKIKNISGGDYGFIINVEKETQDLIAAIKEGQNITKEPKYAQTAFSRGNNDIGNTYVEIDLSGQHLWYYKNGSLVVQGDIVSGNVWAGHTTPAGVYFVKYKELNAVLRGQGYEAPVTFWMPFNGGIGMHDANWRTQFGGTYYKTDGSHGCINCPYDLAKTIYQNIQAGTPVVCYY